MVCFCFFFSSSNRPTRLQAWWTTIFFFFSSRRRHTRLQGDWSSDVCSSDLCARAGPAPGTHRGTAHVPPLSLLPLPRPLHRRRSDPPLRDTSARPRSPGARRRSEEHTSELQSPCNLVCRLLLEKKKKRPVAS